MTKASSDRKRKRAKFMPHVGGRKAGIPAGLQGFLITCVGGKERNSVREATNMLEMFLETLRGDETKTIAVPPSASKESATNVESGHSKDEAEELEGSSSSQGSGSDEEDESEAKNRRTEGIDQLLEAELNEIRGKKKVKFSGFETGCHGIIFVGMRKVTGGPGPVEIAEAVVQSAADTKTTPSRNCMRVMPAEATMYSSKADVERGAKPVILHHFPTGAEQAPLKFAIVCESRANTTLDKMELIKTVAELVPKPHKVDLRNPDKTILVQIVKTTCVIGVVRRFKELAKYNLRQLTSESKPVDQKQVKLESSVIHTPPILTKEQQE